MSETAMKYKLYKCLQCGRKVVKASDPTRDFSIAECEPCGGKFLRLVSYSIRDLDIFVESVEGLDYRL